MILIALEYGRKLIACMVGMEAKSLGKELALIRHRYGLRNDACITRLVVSKRWI